MIFIPLPEHRTRMYILMAFAGVLLLSLLIGRPKQTGSTAEYKPAHPPAALKGKKKIKTPVKGGGTITVYEPGTGSSIGLPASDAPGKHILAAGDVPPSEGGATVAATYDDETGDTTMDYKLKDRPFIGFEGKTEVGARYGIGTNGEAASLYARRDLIRLGPAHIAGYGEANFDKRGPEAKAAIDVSVRW